MIFQAILIILLLLFFLYALRARRQSPLARLVAASFAAALIVLAAFPGISSRAAAALGIGRGVDLLFYIAHLLAIFVGFRFYLKFKELEDRIVTLSRNIALRDASAEDGREGRSAEK